MALAPRASDAQRVRGPEDDASVLRRGQLRVSIRSDWSFANERYVRDGAAGGTEPLGADLGGSPLGAAAFPSLTPVRSELQTFLGTPLEPLSLGQVRTALDLSVFRTPISLDLGVTDRLMLSVVVPYVKTRSDVSVYANTPAGDANVGLNPALFPSETSGGALAANERVVTQLTTAASTLAAELARCAGSTDPTCAAINANRNGAAALVTAAGAAAGSIARIYGTPDVRGSVFAPLGGSPLALQVENRLAALATQFGTFLGAPQSGDSWVDGRPYASPYLAHADFQRALTDTAAGIAGVALETVERSHLGDVEVGAKFLILDTSEGAPGGPEPRRGVRLAVAAAYRFATAQIESPDNFADVGTGDRQPDVDVRGFLDLYAGPRFWTSLSARYVLQLPDRQIMRITAAPGDPFPELFRRQEIERDLGDILSFDVTPRLTPNDAISFGATYRFTHKALDSYEGQFSVDDGAGGTVELDASTLGLLTDYTEQRLGLGITYSSVAAWRRGGARWPIDVTLAHSRVFAGNNALPKLATTTLGMRYYHRLFGPDDRVIRRRPSVLPDRPRR
jgi:hypothetical protein